MFSPIMHMLQILKGKIFAKVSVSIQALVCLGKDITKIPNYFIQLHFAMFLNGYSNFFTWFN